MATLNLRVIGSGFGFASYCHFLTVHIWERSLLVSYHAITFWVVFLFFLHSVGHLSQNVEQVVQWDVRNSWQTVCVKLLRLQLLVKCFYELHLPDRKSCTDRKILLFLLSLSHTHTLSLGSRLHLSSSMSFIMTTCCVCLKLNLRRYTNLLEMGVTGLIQELLETCIYCFM